VLKDKPKDLELSKEYDLKTPVQSFNSETWNTFQHQLKEKKQHKTEVQYPKPAAWVKINPLSNEETINFKPALFRNYIHLKLIASQDGRAKSNIDVKLVQVSGWQIYVDDEKFWESLKNVEDSHTK